MPSGRSCQHTSCMTPPPPHSIQAHPNIRGPSYGDTHRTSCRTQGAHTSAIAASVDRVPHQCLQHHCMVMGETEGAAGSGRRASKAQSL